MYRWLRVLVTLLTLVGLSFAGHVYRVCRVTGEPMPSCCCAQPTPPGEVAATPRTEVTNEPCCESRVTDATPSVAVGKAELAPSWLKTLAVAWRFRVVNRLPFVRAVAPYRWLRDREPSSPRGPPPRRGKARARFAVTLC